MGESELWVRFMCKYDLWLNMNHGGETYKHTQTHKQADMYTHQYDDSAWPTGRAE